MTKKEAIAAAKKLAKRAGPGWKPRVWETLGWHYCVEHGKRTQLHEFGPKSYWLDLQIRGNPQLIGNGKTPRHAIANACAKVNRWYQKLDRLLP